MLDFPLFLWWIFSQCPCPDRNMDGTGKILPISLDIKGSIRIHMHQALQSVKTNNILHRLDLLSRWLGQLILQKRKTARLDTLLAAATCFLSSQLKKINKLGFQVYSIFLHIIPFRLSMILEGFWECSSENQAGIIFMLTGWS